MGGAMEADLVETLTGTVVDSLGLPAEMEAFDSQDSWLAARRRSIGSSELASILGKGRFENANPYAVYRSKVFGDEIDATPAMEAGCRLEAGIRDWAAEKAGVSLVATPRWVMFRNPQHAHLHDTPDGLAVDEQGVAVPLEIKYQARGRHDYEADGIPADYLIQCQHHMLILGAPRCLFAVLSGETFHTEWVERHHEFQEVAAGLADRWWKQHIEAQEPPDIHHAPLAEVKRFYPESVKGKQVELSDEAARKVDAWRMAMDHRKAAQTTEETVEAWVRAEMGDAEVGVLPDGRVIKLSTVNVKGYQPAPVDPYSYRRLYMGRARS